MSMFDNPLIKQLTKKDFEKKGKVVSTPKISYGIIFVVVSWCGHCKALKPDIEKLATAFGMRFPIYYIDGDKDSSLLNLLGVAGFPTIFLIQNKILTNYNSSRDATSIANAICKSTEGNYCFRV